MKLRKYKNEKKNKKNKIVITSIITNLRNVCLAGSENLLATHFFVKIFAFELLYFLKFSAYLCGNFHFY